MPRTKQTLRMMKSFPEADRTVAGTAMTIDDDNLRLSPDPLAVTMKPDIKPPEVIGPDPTALPADHPVYKLEEAKAYYGDDEPPPFLVNRSNKNKDTRKPVVLASRTGHLQPDAPVSELVLRPWGHRDAFWTLDVDGSRWIIKTGGGGPRGGATYRRWLGPDDGVSELAIAFSNQNRYPRLSLPAGDVPIKSAKKRARALSLPVVDADSDDSGGSEYGKKEGDSKGQKKKRMLFNSTTATEDDTASQGDTIVTQQNPLAALAKRALDKCVSTTSKEITGIADENRPANSLYKGLKPTTSFTDDDDFEFVDGVSESSDVISSKKKSQGLLNQAAAQNHSKRPRDEMIKQGSNSVRQGLLSNKGPSRPYGRENYASQVGLSSGDVFERKQLTSTGAEIDSPQHRNNAKYKSLDSRTGMPQSTIIVDRDLDQNTTSTGHQKRNHYSSPPSSTMAHRPVAHMPPPPIPPSLTPYKLTNTTLHVHLSPSSSGYVPIYLSSCPTMATFTSLVLSAVDLENAESTVAAIEVRFDWLKNERTKGKDEDGGTWEGIGGVQEPLVVKRKIVDSFSEVLKVVDKAPCWEEEGGGRCVVDVRVVVK